MATLLQATGTAASDNFIFNSGTVSSNGIYLADITDMTVTLQKTVKGVETMNTILQRKLSVTQFKCGFKATLISANAAFFGIFLGSSAANTAPEVDYYTLDGQQAAFSSLLTTVYIGNDKTQPIQFQWNSAVIKSSPFTFKTNDYATIEVEVEAISVTVVDNATNQ